MSINITFWNVRGININEKHQAFSNWLITNNISIGAILETHIKESNLTRIMSILCPQWSFVSNHLEDEDGRIILFWKAPVTVTLLHMSRQSLTCAVNIPGKTPFTMTAIYAANTADERKLLWNSLVDMKHNLSLHSSPWIIGGDFNEIIHCAEHSSPSFSTIIPQMIDFRTCLDDLEIRDLRFHGPPFTWTNKQPDDPIAKKLDRVLVNEDWLITFPNSLAHFQPPVISDHTPAVIPLDTTAHVAGTKPFKFFNYLTSHPDFLSTVLEGWESTSDDMWSLSTLSKKQKALKKFLKRLHKHNYSEIQKRVGECTELVKGLQRESLQNPSTETFLAEREGLDKLQHLKKVEEAYFRQKSRIQWLKEGDLNTSFYHRVAMARNYYNAIHVLTDLSGITVNTPEAVGLLAVRHFASILGPYLSQSAPFLQQMVDLATCFHCSPEQAEALVKLPTEEDIMRTLFKLNPNKSPGPDGLTSRFYSCTWNILGKEVTASISKFFESGNLPTATNSSILTLIPKFSGATSIKDYRPISCCNTTYKVISKILVSKLKPLLPSIILPNQSAFIKGRLLLENCLLASEIVSGDHKNKGPKRLILKVDIAKAFDSLKWDFVVACLYSLQLPHRFILWIQECISTAAYSVGINGSLHGYFKGTRGLRQGDPLSPYLFGIAMNVLSHQLNKAAEEGSIGYHPRCKDSKLTHLCFADDLLIFSDGSPRSLQGILSVLSQFQELSGLAISPQKSCFFSAGLSATETSTITSSSGIPQGILPMRYLGLPLTTKKLSLLNCEPLLQKIKSKLSLWTTKYLSFAGRLQLLSSVIIGIINFWCAAFILPVECINQINSLCAAFLWKGNLEGRYSAKVAWEAVTTPKEEGGLGLRNIAAWNKTCTLKLLWMLFFRRESVWVAWIHQNVIKDKCFWLLKENQSQTWLFKQILRLREEALNWIKIVPGNGRTCNFWTTPWSQFGQLIKFIGANGPRQTGISISSTLSSMWIENSWIMGPARTTAMEQVQTHLSTISLSDSDDYPVWTKDGVAAAPGNSFVSAKIYHSLRVSKPRVPWAKVVWLKKGIPRHKTLTWLFLLDRCPTRDRILSWGLQTDPLCLLCNHQPESRDHIFFRCSFSSQLWGSFSSRLRLPPTIDWDQTVDSLIALNGDVHKRFLAILVWQAAIYEIWRERNNRLHRRIFKTQDSLIASINSIVTNRISAMRDQNPAESSACMQFWFSLG